MLHSTIMQNRNARPEPGKRPPAVDAVAPAVALTNAGNQALLRISGRSQPHPSRAPMLQRECAACKDERENKEAGIQTQLTVNTPGDVYEQEADRVADQVMRMPASAVQAQAAMPGL